MIVCFYSQNRTFFQQLEKIVPLTTCNIQFFSINLTNMTKTTNNETDLFSNFYFLLDFVSILFALK